MVCRGATATGLAGPGMLAGLAFPAHHLEGAESLELDLTPLDQGFLDELEDGIHHLSAFCRVMPPWTS